MNGCFRISGRLLPDFRLRVHLRDQGAATSVRIPLLYAGLHDVKLEATDRNYQVRVDKRQILLKPEGAREEAAEQVRAFEEHCVTRHFSLSLEAGFLKITDHHSVNGTIVEWRDPQLAEVIADNVDLLHELAEEASIEPSHRLHVTGEGRMVRVPQGEAPNSVLLERVEGQLAITDHASDLPDHLMDIAAVTVRQFNWERRN